MIKLRVFGLADDLKLRVFGFADDFKSREFVQGGLQLTGSRSRPDIHAFLTRYA